MADAGKPLDPKRAPLPQKPSESFPSPLETEIVENLSDLIPSPDTRGLVAERVVSVMSTELFSGPIAHPKHLAEYEQTCPGAADRIIAMAEERNKRLLDMADRRLEAEIADQRRGMHWGGVLFGLMILAALMAALVTRDAKITAAFMGLAALGGISHFILGRNGSQGSKSPGSKNEEE